jgi:polyribonucleotide nucleotidyltransferase
MRERKVMNEKIEKSVDFAGKKMTVSTNLLAKQANGSCLVTTGDTTILINVVAANEPRLAADFLPLTVDYRERTFAAGKIPGGFFKREGRPRQNEILTSRLIDRTLRPLFPESWHNDTQITAIVLSTDMENDSDISSIIGASIALKLSDVPFHDVVGAVRIGRIEGKFIVNPTVSEQKLLDIDLVVSGTKDGLCMVEAGAHEVSEAELVEAIKLAHEEIKKICAFQETFNGKKKKESAAIEVDPKLKKSVETLAGNKTADIVKIKEKKSREDAWSALKKEIVAKLETEYPEQEAVIKQLLEDSFYVEARRLIAEKNIRSDGRGLDDIRPIECLTSVLPRTHGSALFTRGQTQALVTVTLGNPKDMQIMDELLGEYKERFMLHYNFPGFATGEAKPERSPGRREIGHGALARRALLPLLPNGDDFPYALRVVSDILESNGSSSMASVCGGSLALFDAGVPLKASCAGIAMGLIKEGGKNIILTDIMGMEDHIGDMDFKVAGTRKGVTALQMDIKIKGLTAEIMTEALEKARVARLKILDLMEKALPEPKADLSTYAPRMVTVQIPQSKIGELIGPGGKNIRRIQEESKAEIQIEEDGRVFISSPLKDSVELAKQMVESLVCDVEVGKTYKGRVTRILNFGAFVEILPGKEGLVHISQLAEGHVKKVEDVVHEGDELTVKVMEIDSQGRVNLSRKAVLQETK